MRGRIALAGSATKSTTGAYAEAPNVRFAFFDQRFSFGFLFCRQNRGDLHFRVAHRCPNLLMKRFGARLIFGRERTLASFLTKLLQFCADSFIASEGLLDDGSNLLFLVV